MVLCTVKTLHSAHIDRYPCRVHPGGLLGALNNALTLKMTGACTRKNRRSTARPAIRARPCGSRPTATNTMHAPPDHARHRSSAHLSREGIPGHPQAPIQRSRFAPRTGLRCARGPRQFTVISVSGRDGPVTQNSSFASWDLAFSR